MLGLLTIIFTIGIILTILQIRLTVTPMSSNKIHSHGLTNVIPNCCKETNSHKQKIILHWTGWYKKKYNGNTLDKNWYQNHCPVRYGTGITIAMIFFIFCKVDFSSNNC